VEEEEEKLLAGRIDQAFSELNRENIEKIEEMIKEKGLDFVLEEEAQLTKPMEELTLRPIWSSANNLLTPQNSQLDLTLLMNGSSNGKKSMNGHNGDATPNGLGHSRGSSDSPNWSPNVH
jgi:hypothetical protein